METSGASAGDARTVGEVPVGEKELVQADLNGDTVKVSEELKEYDTYLVPGYRLRIGSDTLAAAPDRLEDKRCATNKGGIPKNSARDLQHWKEAFVYNKIKANPTAEHNEDDATSLFGAMLTHIFDAEDMPEGIRHVHEKVPYKIWTTGKFEVRVPEKAWGKKKEKWTKATTKKKGKAKALSKVGQQVKNFAASKMRLKNATFATEGEYRGYLKEITKAMLKELGIDGLQETLG